MRASPGNRSKPTIGRLTPDVNLQHPDPLLASASSRMRSLYSALKRLRLALAKTSGLGTLFLMGSS